MSGSTICIALTPRVFCAVMAVRAVVAKTPKALNRADVGLDARATAGVRTSDT